MLSGGLETEFTQHAVHVMEERKILREWVESALADPELRTSDPDDSEVERFYRRVPEFGDRMLRVAVNTSGTPWKVVSAFFDRNAGGAP